MTPPASGWDDGAAPWLATYPVGVPTSYRYPVVSAVRLLDDAAQDFPDMVAVEYHRYRLTYRKLLDHVDRFATGLAALGVTTGDQVVCALPNCPQLVIALFATWRIGAAAVLLPREALDSATPDRARVVVTLDGWHHAMGRSSSAALAERGDVERGDVVVTTRDDYLPFPRNVLSALRGRRWLTGRSRRGSGAVTRFTDLVRRSVPAPPESVAPHRRVAVSTAATSISQQQLVVNSFQLRLWLPDVVAGDERVLLAIPLTAATGVVWMLTAVLSAATMILLDDARPVHRQRSAVAARPTILPLDDDLADDLLRSSWRSGHLHSVRIAVSNTTLDPAVRRRLEALTDKGRIRAAWGVGGLLTHADPIYGRAQAGSVGLPLPDTEAVVLAAGRSGPVVGARGRLWVRGPQLERTEWVDVGVDGTLDAAGYLTVHDDPAAAHA